MDYIKTTRRFRRLSLLNPLTAAYCLCTIRPMKSTYPTMQRLADGGGVEGIVRSPATQSLRSSGRRRPVLLSRARRQALKNA